MMEPMNPDADPRVELAGMDMWCGGCGGYGVVSDAMPITTTLVVVEWTTAHARGCPGLVYPARTFVMDLERLDAGDACLPSPPIRPGRRPTRPRCRAMVPSAGRQCRNAAGPDGLCSAHGGRRP